MTDVTWTAQGSDTDIRYETSGDGIAKEGREAYKAKRRPDFSQFPGRP